MKQDLRFPIPGFSRYDIDRNGVVRNKYSDTVIEITSTFVGGPVYMLTNDDCSLRAMGGRRLEALVEREQRLNGNEDFRFPPPPKIQAKHIPDALVKLLVLQLTHRPVVDVIDGRVRASVESYVSLDDIYNAWPTVPKKVIYAKVMKMIDRGILDGDVGIKLTEKGTRT